MLLNGASFSNNFSTILRMAWHAEMSTEVTVEDSDGRDPLPAHLAEACLSLSSAAGSGRFIALKEVGTNRATKTDTASSMLLDHDTH